MNKKEMKQSTKLSIDLISTIIVTLIAGAVTVAAVISMAWFASNKEVGTNGSSVTVDAELFEIGYNKSTNQLSGDNSLNNLLTNIQYDLNGTNDTSHSTLFLTRSDNAKIACKINITSEDEEGHTETTIRPGSYGYFSFFIIPKKDNLTFRINSELIGISTGDSYFADSEFSVSPNISEEDDEETIAQKTLAATNETDRIQTALGLLNGHILLFRDESFADILDDVVYVDYATTAETEYEGRIYWKWIRTYTQLTGYISDPENDPNRDMYLYDGSGDIGYNNGDQTIGDTFNSILIQLLVDVVNDGNIPEGGMILTEPTT